ncbi:hypothetical protein V6615_15145 [Oscillospiraceae bacterium PP1C4]
MNSANVQLSKKGFYSVYDKITHYKEHDDIEEVSSCSFIRLYRLFKGLAKEQLLTIIKGEQPLSKEKYRIVY